MTATASERHVTGVEEPAGPAAPRRPRARMGRAALIIGVQIVLFAGFWGVFLVGGGDDGLPAEPVASVQEAVAIPGGTMRVESVLPWGAMDHNAPGMQVPDPVPAGKRRVLVDVTLTAVERPLTLRMEAFSLAGSTMSPVEPWWGTMGVEQITKGAQTTVTLAFDVPKSASGLRFGLRGGSRTVAVDDGAATVVKRPATKKGK